MKSESLGKFALVFLIIICFGLFSCDKEDNDDEKPPEKTPVALDGQEIYQTNFLAQWEFFEGATKYKIDVSESQQFNSYVKGFHNKDVGNVTRAYVYGLENNKTYYFRIRPFIDETACKYSNTIEVTTGGEDQLPNMDMEMWTDFPKYSVPSPIGIWATPNKIVDLLLYMDPPPVTVEKTTDAVSGEYAAKIMTILPEDFILLTGTVATGIFDPDMQNQLESLKQGVPFTSKPVAFKGYYKYLPVDSDSCDIYSYLTHWNLALNERDTVAAAKLTTNDVEVDTYTEFNLTYNYLTADEPDTIILIFASSAAGDSFIGGVGSTLYIDDISLVYE